MGYDATAYAVLGVKIDGSVFKDVEDKAFDHNFPPDVKYHPQTGKPLYVKFKGNIFDGGEDLPREIASGVGFVIGFVVEDWNQVRQGREVVYMGLSISSNDRNAMCALTPNILDDVEHKIKGIVAKHNLKVGPFGMHAVKHESY